MKNVEVWYQFQAAIGIRKNTIAKFINTSFQTINNKIILNSSQPALRAALLQRMNLDTSY